jgi:hypothetical protein
MAPSRSFEPRRRTARVARISWLLGEERVLPRCAWRVATARRGASSAVVPGDSSPLHPRGREADARRVPARGGREAEHAGRAAPNAVGAAKIRNPAAPGV